jgi:hypothetical protein
MVFSIVIESFVLKINYDLIDDQKILIVISNRFQMLLLIYH